MTVAFCASSQKNTSFSLGYDYLAGKGNSGLTVRFKTDLWKNVPLIADVNYFFRKYQGIFENNFQKEYYQTFYLTSVNLGYNLALSDKISLIPYAGFGLFAEQMDGYMSSNGSSSNSGYYGAPYNVSVNDVVTAPFANVGLLLEGSLSEKLFLTGGVKTQVDLYDGSYSGYPCLTVGLGYKL